MLIFLVHHVSLSKLECTESAKNMLAFTKTGAQNDEQPKLKFSFKISAVNKTKET